MPYRLRLKKRLTSPERALFIKLNSARRIQDYLDSLPINFECSGETYMSPRRTLVRKTAHCFEAALLAAAAFAYHGKKPLLLDLKSIRSDEDHVVAPFTHLGYWGAVSKTNHAVLRYRDPVYKSIRELAMSYFHEYTSEDGRKTMRSYSYPLDLSKYSPERWVTEERDLFWLVAALDESRHVPVASKKTLQVLRRATRFELDVLDSVEWPHKPPKKPKRADS